MEIKKFLIDFVILFCITLVINAIVIYLWNLIRHGEGAFDWELSFALSVAIGIALPLLIKLGHALERPPKTS